MKYWLFFVLSCFISFKLIAQVPDGFVYVKTVISDLDVELRYRGYNNFIGGPVDGYNTNRLILTKETALALKLVQNELHKKGLALKVFDGYRPQQAVNHFVRWAKDLNDTINKKRFYPD